MQREMADDPGGCWLVSGPDGEVLSLLIGHKSEVVGESRIVPGFYREGRSGSVRLLSPTEVLVQARARRHARFYGPIGEAVQSGRGRAIRVA